MCSLRLLNEFRMREYLLMKLLTCLASDIACRYTQFTNDKPALGRVVCLRYTDTDLICRRRGSFSLNRVCRVGTGWRLVFGWVEGQDLLAALNRCSSRLQNTSMSLRTDADSSKQI